MLYKHKIKSIPTSIKNPQSNAIVEQMHQLISTMIAIGIRENPPRNFEDVFTLIFRKCMAAQYAVRTTANTTLKYTPGELVFGRDMILPVTSNIYWNQLFQRKQNVITKTNLQENKSRKDFDYQVGQRVLI